MAIDDLVDGKLKKIMTSLLAPALAVGIATAKPIDSYAAEAATLPAIGEYKAEGWDVPNLTGLTPYKDKMYDLEEEIPGPETRAEKFKILNGKVFRLSHNGNIWSYTIVGPDTYKLMDSDGDGVFETKLPARGIDYPYPTWTYN